MKLELILKILALTFATSSAKRLDNFTLEIVYDSLEPGSIEFMTDQYWPAFFHLKDYVYVNACPFGQAKMIDNQKIDYCVRGPSECFLNFLHVCMRNVQVSAEKKVGFVFCTIMSADPSQSLHRCADKFQIDWEELYSCLPTAQQIVRERIRKLVQLSGRHRKYLPIVYFKEQYVPELQYSATTRFMHTVCFVMSEYAKPAMCKVIKEHTAGIDIYYFVPMAIVAIAIVGTGLGIGIKFLRK